ncbi:MAG: UDP-N-acetylglucosamine pyrophosphorylase [Nitrospinae bacterium]|nr:UDP-N-acetylglucosamine pyrophosphorylase [Nitrospinota bacterium]
MVIIILAAGKGTRMRSEAAKVLHILNGKPLLRYVIDLAYKIKPDRIFVVVGFHKEEVKEKFVSENVAFIDQEEQLGTGHAVMQAKSFLGNFKGEVLVLSGDVPFLRESTVNEMIRDHRLNNAAVTILTAEKDNPSGYGRVVRNSNNNIERIAEETDCSKIEKTINEINSGIYCFNKKFLLESLEEIDKNNTQNEYYLTDIVKIAFDNSLPVTSIKVSNPDEVNGINTIEDLVEAEKFLTG